MLLRNLLSILQLFKIGDLDLRIPAHMSKWTNCNLLRSLDVSLGIFIFFINFWVSPTSSLRELSSS